MKKLEVFIPRSNSEALELLRDTAWFVCRNGSAPCVAKTERSYILCADVPDLVFEIVRRTGLAKGFSVGEFLEVE